jgi:hypothetical protein
MTGGGAMDNDQADCRRKGFVSLWVGTFATLEAAEAYFGIPDEIGVYLPPVSFASDLGLDDLPVERLEVNFEQLSPRPLRELLQDATFAASFLDQAIEAANQQGIQAAQGVALLYDFDYQARPNRQRAVGPLRFIGTFQLPAATAEELEPKRDSTIDVHEVIDDIW